MRLAASKSSVMNMELESDIIMISAECCSNDFISFVISDKNGKERMNSLICVGLTYFNELTNMAQLTEEVGEVARIISRTYGEQSNQIPFHEPVPYSIHFACLESITFLRIHCNQDYPQTISTYHVRLS